VGVSALAARIASDAARSYLGRSADHPGQERALADPLCIVEAMQAPSKLPALFIAAGLHNPVACDSQRLERELVRLESPCSAHHCAGEPQASNVMFWRESAICCWRDGFEFLRRHLPGKAKSALRACGPYFAAALQPAEPMRNEPLAPSP